MKRHRKKRTEVVGIFFTVEHEMTYQRVITFNLLIGYGDTVHLAGNGLAGAENLGKNVLVDEIGRERAFLVVTAEAVQFAQQSAMMSITLMTV
jgi:hypothetical protein